MMRLDYDSYMKLISCSKLIPKMANDYKHGSFLFSNSVTQLIDDTISILNNIDHRTVAKLSALKLHIFHSKKGIILDELHIPDLPLKKKKDAALFKIFIQYQEILDNLLKNAETTIIESKNAMKMILVSHNNENTENIITKHITKNDLASLINYWLKSDNTRELIKRIVFTLHEENVLIIFNQAIDELYANILTSCAHSK